MLRGFYKHTTRGGSKARYEKAGKKGDRILVGIGLHPETWHVTIRTEDLKLLSASITGNWKALEQMLARYPGYDKQVVYEAGYYGFWLHDRLVEYGAECIVRPPSLIPQKYGNHVKTDRRDSRKLAHLLAKGLLKRVWVPSAEKRCQRQVIRRRRKLIADRVRT